MESVVGDDAVLERADYGYGGVEGVAEQEVADEVDEGLLELPDLTYRAVELPEPGGDDVHACWNLDFVSIPVGYQVEA